jgi:hypothetical protein
MSCGRPPGCLRRFFFRLAPWRKRCDNFLLDEPPPDSFVREPRRSNPQAPGGSIALGLPPEWRSLQPPSAAGTAERAWARNQTVEIENDLKEYDYRPGYYAGFFYDPDGIKLEIVHSP